MEVLMPQLGETVEEGKVIVWHKSVGDAVAVGDTLFEIETDKVTTDVPAITAGVLTEIRVGVDESAPVGAVVAVISDAASAAASAPRETTSPSPVVSSATTTAAPLARADVKAAPAVVRAAQPPRKMDPFNEVRTPVQDYGPARTANGIAVTPFARRLAAELSVDLGAARSGGDGPIRGKDVAALGAAAGRTQRQPAGKSQGASTGLSAEQTKASYVPGSYVEHPADNMRKVIARRLQESKQTVPHFYAVVDLELDALMRLREEINAGVPRQPGKAEGKLSVNDLLIKAWAMALTQVPAANAVWAHDSILQFAQADIGVAIAVEGGLFTPVVRNAGVRTVHEISSAMRDLVTRARERKLKPDDLQGGASSISNLGMYGVREFSAIINPPQSTILAVGAIQRRAVEAADGAVRFASLMTATLSCDHRVVDGVLGAQVLAALREIIHQPERIVTADDKH